MLWGDEATVRARFNGDGDGLKFTRQIARMRFPFDPAGTVDFFRTYYGPTLRSFGALSPGAQVALRHDLIELQTRHNVSADPGSTDTPSEYLEIHARLRTVAMRM
jgi:hypothetical protein